MLFTLCYVKYIWMVNIQWVDKFDKFKLKEINYTDTCFIIC